MTSLPRRRTLLELAGGSTPSSRRGFNILVLTMDFVQSPVLFFAAVEAEEALVAAVFFAFPIMVGKLSLRVEKREMV
jgi:hypothetical protein